MMCPIYDVLHGDGGFFEPFLLFLRVGLGYDFFYLYYIMPLSPSFDADPTPRCYDVLLHFPEVQSRVYNYNPKSRSKPRLMTQFSRWFLNATFDMFFIAVLTLCKIMDWYVIGIAVELFHSNKNWRDSSHCKNCLSISCAWSETKGTHGSD